MANPNIVGVSSIYGRSQGYALNTISSNVVTNSVGSNTVIKLNSAIATNVNGAGANVSITATYYDESAQTEYYVANTIVVPGNSSLVLVSKEYSIYLEEGDKFGVVAGANNSLELIVSYEEIS